MSTAIDYVVSAILIGSGATAFIDAWALGEKWFRGRALPDNALFGRWVAHLARGRFRHDSIAAAPRIRGERAIGWITHYLIGIAFASVLLAVWGLDWARHPTIGPALIVGIGSVAAPYLILHPGMGAGIAASRAPNPTAARLHSLVTHAVFGVGLYVAGWVTSGLAS